MSATELKANAAATATALNGVSTNLSTLTGRVTAVEGVAGASVTALTTRVTATEGVANAAAKQSDHTTLAGRQGHCNRNQGQCCCYSCQRVSSDH